MRVCLFEDRADSLAPLSLTRPVFDLICGQTALWRKQHRHFAARECGFLVRPHLEELTRLERPEAPVNDLAWLRRGTTMLVNGRWLPPPEPAEFSWGPCVGLAAGEVAFAIVEPAQVQDLGPATLADHLEQWQSTLPSCQAGGAMIRYPWDLVEHNAEQLRRDFAAMLRDERRPALPTRLAIVGPQDEAWIDPRARLDPYVVADTTQGPVVVDEHAVVTAFTRLEGPCYVGPHAQVHGAKVRAGTTLGPHCRVGGEIEASILHGYSNKYHEGFLGHSYLGEWVNLGAGTHNSDLRNDYGEVTVTIAGAPPAGKPVATGLSKVGCFLGDHTKTGLGTLINTGTSAGVFTNLLPAGRFAPRHVPSFTTWWNGNLREHTGLDALLATARRVMQRRGQALTEAHATLYRHLESASAADRRRVIRDSEQRALRRSA